jgi:hypothetical protein
MNQTSKSPERPRVPWPVNEIVLQALVSHGKKDDEIAEIYHVPAKLVAERREEFGL